MAARPGSSDGSPVRKKEHGTGAGGPAAGKLWFLPLQSFSLDNIGVCVREGDVFLEVRLFGDTQKHILWIVVTFCKYKHFSKRFFK